MGNRGGQNEEEERMERSAGRRRSKREGAKIKSSGPIPLSSCLQGPFMYLVLDFHPSSPSSSPSFSQLITTHTKRRQQQFPSFCFLPSPSTVSPSSSSSPFSPSSLLYASICEENSNGISGWMSDNILYSIDVLQAEHSDPKIGAMHRYSVEKIYDHVQRHGDVIVDMEVLGASYQV